MDNTTMSHESRFDAKDKESSARGACSSTQEVGKSNFEKGSRRLGLETQTIPHMKTL